MNSSERENLLRAEERYLDDESEVPSVPYYAFSPYSIFSKKTKDNNKIVKNEDNP